mmetsp:Transcript_16103/g.48503  ORF Transcript_16103/g.48503 Transcript_16103/m.48503 type:complete len:228 (-) Transcript_16103:516-1199(-)
MLKWGSTSRKRNSASSKRRKTRRVTAEFQTYSQSIETAKWLESARRKYSTALLVLLVSAFSRETTCGSRAPPRDSAPASLSECRVIARWSRQLSSRYAEAQWRQPSFVATEPWSSWYRAVSGVSWKQSALTAATYSTTSSPRAVSSASLTPHAARNASSRHRPPQFLHRQMPSGSCGAAQAKSTPPEAARPVVRPAKRSWHLGQGTRRSSSTPAEQSVQAQRKACVS